MLQNGSPPLPLKSPLLVFTGIESSRVLLYSIVERVSAGVIGSLDSLLVFLQERNNKEMNVAKIEILKLMRLILSEI